MFSKLFRKQPKRVYSLEEIDIARRATRLNASGQKEAAVELIRQHGLTVDDVVACVDLYHSARGQ